MNYTATLLKLFRIVVFLVLMLFIVNCSATVMCVMLLHLARHGMEVVVTVMLLTQKLGRTLGKTRERSKIHEERLLNLNAMFLSC